MKRKSSIKKVSSVRKNKGVLKSNSEVKAPRRIIKKMDFYSILCEPFNKPQTKKQKIILKEIVDDFKRKK